MNRRLILKSFAWTMAVSSVFSLALGASLISVVVGDWIYIHTEELWLGWLVGCFVLAAFVVSIGVGAGAWLWIRNPDIRAKVDPTPSVPTSIEHMLTAASKHRD